MLKFDHKQLDMKLEAADRDMTLPEGGLETLDRMRAKRMWNFLEMKRRDTQLNVWAPIAGLLGLGIFLSSFVSLFGRKRKKVEGESYSADEVSGAYVWPPRELYSDEWEYDRQREGGFVSRDQAIAHLQKDPLKRCEYCGGEMNPTIDGQREGIELVTFYKKVPEGARDLRVVLGSYWFAKSAPELKCNGCERVVRR